MRTTERMEKALQTLLYFFILCVCVAWKTPAPHLCFSRDFLCAKSHGLQWDASSPSGAVGWVGWMGMVGWGLGMSDIQGELSTAIAAVGACQRRGARLGEDCMDLHSSLRLHRVPGVTKALGSAQDTWLNVTNQPDWWRGCLYPQASSGAALGFALVLGSCRRTRGTLFIAVAPAMALPLQTPPTSQQTVPKHSLWHPNTTLLPQQPSLSPVSHAVTALHMPLQFPFPRIFILPSYSRHSLLVSASPCSSLCCCFGEFVCFVPLDFCTDNAEDVS